MTDAKVPLTAPVLDPIDRLSEILFGLVMVLGFTGSMSVATANRGDVTEMLIGAIGCSVAWGLIDSMMFLMARLHERGRDMQTVRALKQAGSQQAAHQVIRNVLPPVVAEKVDPEALERIRIGILEAAPPSAKPKLSGEDLRGAISVFVIVVAAAIPVILPFAVLTDPALAMRLSNIIALVALAITGYAYGRISGLMPWWTSLAMVMVGSAFVGLTILLGG